MFNLCYENAHCHTYMSNPLTLPDSTVSIEDYVKVYKERGMQCVVASEHGYRGDVWAQADAAKKYSDDSFKMKPICAAEAYFVPKRDPELADDRNFHLLLIAKNNSGFKQLNKILSESQMTGYYKHGRLDFELLSMLNYKDFLCTTACVGGILKDPLGEAYACKLAEIFKENFRLEVQYHLNPVQIAHNEKVLKLYKKYKWPLFFATDSHYINKEDAILRKELQLSANINMPDSDWCLYLPTAEDAYNDMVAQNVFTKAQIEEAMENTLELREFEGFSYTTERKLPISKIRQNLTPEQRKKLYQRMVCSGYIDKAGRPSDEEAKKLREEMNVIINTNSEDYFISLKDMLDRGVELGGVLTTTARGSAGSFASNYALGFTTINRLKAPVTMYPERFISADKLKAGNPDIDSNLCNVEAFEQAGKEMFGEYGCLPLVAYGKTKVLSAFKLLARARNLDFEISNEVSKQISAYEIKKKQAIENNSDDPDYDVDDYVHIEEFVDEKYLQLIEDSKKYQQIVVNITPHPCAHLTYHKDMREEIGIVRLKAKTGNKEPKYCLYIDGVTADKLNYVKSDLLRVDVVKVISDSFKACGLPVMSVDELLTAIDGDPNIWNLYRNGFTQGLNQCEKYASTQKCMTFAPKNIVELCAFVAAIRPGFKSMIQTFINRDLFKYNIKALDELLTIDGMTGNSGQSSFLLFDEQILRILIAGGIPAAEAYATIKHIKKKHRDQVLAEKEKFKVGFTSYLKEKENASDELASDVVEKIWKIIEDSSSYLFCCAHAFAYACDSAYGAWLKAYHPYEFYSTMLKLYTNKGQKEKISLIISEMKKYKNIKLIPGRFGEDNTDWIYDKENATISQSLSSIKFISQEAAEDLRDAGQGIYGYFTDVLRELQMNTCLNSRQIEILIKINYFEDYGKTGKLMRVFHEFNGDKEYCEGKYKVSKTVKSFEKRMDAIREIEKNEPDEEIDIAERLKTENDNIGLCFSTEDCNKYFVYDVEDKFNHIVRLYNVRTGSLSPVLRVKKGFVTEKNLKIDDIVHLDRSCISERNRYVYKNGKRIAVQGEKEMWLENIL